MASRTDNQYRRSGLEDALDEFLTNASKAGELPIVKGRLNRADIRTAIGCGDNWLSQNKYARMTLKKWDERLHEEGLACEHRPPPTIRNQSTDNLKKYAENLRRRNAQLMAEVSDLRLQLSEYEWLGCNPSDETRSRLPW
jgi:hypothetical protein